MSQITISAVRIVDSHAEYAIERDGTNRVWRRYRDFESLRKSLLLDRTTRWLIPDLPPKRSWWASRSSTVVSERKVMLEAFLRKLEGSEMVSSGDKKVAWEAFFDVHTNNDALFSQGNASSTYLAQSAGDLISSAENPLDADQASNGAKDLHSSTISSASRSSRKKEFSAEDMQRIEREVQALKAASTEDVSRFLRTLEEEREESRILRARVEQLENEISSLRKSPYKAMAESSENGGPVRMKRNASSSISLPSLESDEEAKRNREPEQGSVVAVVQDEADRAEAVSRISDGRPLWKDPNTTKLSESIREHSLSPLIMDSDSMLSNVSPATASVVSNGQFSSLSPINIEASQMSNHTFARSAATIRSPNANHLPSRVIEQTIHNTDGTEEESRETERVDTSEVRGRSMNQIPSHEVEHDEATEDEAREDDDWNVEEEKAADSSVVRVKPVEYSGIFQPKDFFGAEEDAKDRGVAEPEKDALDRAIEDCEQDDLERAIEQIINPTGSSYERSSLPEGDDESFGEERVRRLSDLSAIPIVTSTSRDEDALSFESFAEDEEPDMKISASFIISGTTKAAPKPPLPPARPSESERRPPLIHSQTPVNLARDSSPMKRGQGSESSVDDQDSFARRLKAELSSLDDDAAMEAVVRAMELKAAQNETVARFGCKSIMNLSSESKEACEKLGRMGACDAVILAMRSFPESENIALEACGAMSNLALDQWNGQKLRHLGAFRVLINCLETFGGVNQAIALSGLRAILNLLSDRETARAFGRTGGARVAVNCLNSWAEINPDVALEGCVLVRSLAEELPVARELGRLGVCDGIVGALNSFGLQRRSNAIEAMIAIRNLSIDDTNRTIFLRSGGIGALTARNLTRILDKYGKHDRLVVIHGCLALRNLCSKNESNGRILSAAGACEVLIGLGNQWLRQTPPEEEELIYSVCAAVWNLSFDPSAARAFLKHSVSRMLVDALKIYGGKSPKCALITCGAIFRLVATCESAAKKDLLRFGAMNALRNTCPNENLQAAIAILE